MVDPSDRQQRGLSGTALLLLAALTGCAGGYDKQTSLRNAVDEFHDGFRWGAMGSMISHLRATDQDTVMAGYQSAMDGVSIGDYEVQRLVFAASGDEADVWVSLTWYRNTEMDVHNAVMHEHWVQDGSAWNRTEVAVERGELPDGIVTPPAPPPPSADAVAPADSTLPSSVP